MGFSKAVAESFTDIMLQDDMETYIPAQTLLRSTMLVWGYTSQFTQNNIDKVDFMQLASINDILLTVHDFCDRAKVHAVTPYCVECTLDKIVKLSNVLLGVSGSLTSQFIETDSAVIDLKTALKKIMKVFRRTNNFDIDYHVLKPTDILQYACTLGYYLANSGTEYFSASVVKQLREIEQDFDKIVCGYLDIMVCKSSTVCETIMQTKCLSECGEILNKYKKHYDYIALRKAIEDIRVVEDFKNKLDKKYLMLIDKLKVLDGTYLTDSWKLDFTNYILNAHQMLEIYVQL